MFDWSRFWRWTQAPVILIQDVSSHQDNIWQIVKDISGKMVFGLTKIIKIFPISIQPSPMSCKIEKMNIGYWKSETYIEKLTDDIRDIIIDIRRNSRYKKISISTISVMDPWTWKFRSFVLHCRYSSRIFDVHNSIFWDQYVKLWIWNILQYSWSKGLICGLAEGRFMDCGCLLAELVSTHR